MKKIFTLLFAFCFCTLAHAQNTFEKIIDTLGSSSANCIRETLDGGYILCGKSNLNGNDAIAIKLDSTGTIEWAKTYSGPSIEAALQIEQLPDSGYIMNSIYNNGAPPQSHRHWLLRLDKNGNTIWTKNFTAGAGGVEAYAMAVNNGNYGLTGYFKPITPGYSDAYLIITDSLGVAAGSKIYYSNYGSKSFGICRYNNNYVFTGSYLPTSGSVDLYLVCTDSIGDTLWTRTYNNSQTDVGYAVEQTTDNGFIISGYTWNTAMTKYNIYLLKTDSVGDTLWTKVYSMPTEEVAYSIEQTPDGGYIIAGVTLTGGVANRDLYLIKTDAAGDTLWTRKYGSIGPDFGYSARRTKDGGYIVTGSKNLAGIYVIKTDNMGNVTTGTGTAEINNPFDFTIFPNPCNGNFTMRLKGINEKNAGVEIYNMLQQKVFSDIIYGINSTTEIDLGNAATGMYVAVMRAGDKVFSKKVIIEK